MGYICLISRNWLRIIQKHFYFNPPLSFRICKSNIYKPPVLVMFQWTRNNGIGRTVNLGRYHVCFQTYAITCSFRLLLCWEIYSQERLASIAFCICCCNRLIQSILNQVFITIPRVIVHHPTKLLTPLSFGIALPQAIYTTIEKLRVINILPF